MTAARAGTWRMSWPITDPVVGLATLMGQAQHDLAAALAVEDLQPAGRATWTIAHQGGPRMFVDLPVIAVPREDTETTGAVSVAVSAEPGSTPETPAPVPDNDVDQVVVERLVQGADWRALHATRAERVAAALQMPSLAQAERHLGLRAGRDFPNLTERAVS